MPKGKGSRYNRKKKNMPLSKTQSKIHSQNTFSQRVAKNDEQKAKQKAEQARVERERMSVLAAKNQIASCKNRILDIQGRMDQRKALESKLQQAVSTYRGAIKQRDKTKSEIEALQKAIRDALAKKKITRPSEKKKFTQNLSAYQKLSKKMPAFRGLLRQIKQASDARIQIESQLDALPSFFELQNQLRAAQDELNRLTR